MIMLTYEGSMNIQWEKGGVIDKRPQIKLIFRGKSEGKESHNG